MSTRPPADAVVALRSFGRRFRGLFAGREQDESPDELAHRVGPDGHAAVDHIVAATRALTFLGRELQRVLVEEDPALDPGVLDLTGRDWGDAPPGPVEGRLAELGWEADALADQAEPVAAADWGRTGRVARHDEAVSAHGLLWAAVDAVVEHLRAAERTLDAVRGR